ncbi:MAG: MBL fold metallo-hydrolase [Oscillospiraceae bacterium]|nr:MBL fold metallo-hydrolase [Oscillospiraceae bacterium]
MNTVTGLIKFLLKRNSEIAKMKHLETQEIVNGIYAVKTKNANFYVVNYDDDCIAIDAGGGNENIAKAEMDKLNIEPEKITAVLLTHTDFDHISALRLFKNATIYISKQEEQVLDGSVPRLVFGGKNKLNHSYSTIEDNEELYFGKIKVKSVLTPGHTVGSMSFLIDDKYLFVGDNLSLQNGQVGLFNSLFNLSDDTQKESIRNLAKIASTEYIFTAHYGFTDSPREAFKNFTCVCG